VETSLLGYGTTDTELRLTYVNPALAEIVRAPAAELLGTSAVELIHPADRALAAAAVGQLLDHATHTTHATHIPDAIHTADAAAADDLGVPLRLRLVRRDGSLVAVEVGARALLDHPAISGLAIGVTPLRGQGEVDAALRAMARDAELSEILDLLLEAIEGVVADGRVALVVEEHPSQAQWSMPEDLDTALRELPGPTDDTDRSHPGVEALETGELVVRAADDLPPTLRDDAAAAGYRTVWAFPLTTRTFRAVVLVWRTQPREPRISSCEAVDRILGIIGLAIERHRARMVLEHAATHDPLTGLSNRSDFTTRIGRATSGDPAPGRQLGVLTLDLDGFKPINDHHGLRAGDSVLREAAARIVGAVRDTDSVARVGGDEFAVVCPDIESPDILPRVAERIIRAFEEPFVLELTTVTVGVSIGIAVTTMDGVDGPDVDGLLAQADAALHQAKRSGRGRWSMDSTMDSSMDPPAR
jgi:diguanylate cyclase (GGDEF)-like protein